MTLLNLMPFHMLSHNGWRKCKSYENDDWATKMLTGILINPSSEPDSMVADGLLRYKNRLYIGAGGELRRKLLAQMHDSPMGGHSGQQGTYYRLKQPFFWKGMKRDVIDLVRQCDVCQMCKEENMATPRLLQPIKIPNQALASILMDFIEGLPKSQGKEVILVVDRFTKYNHFIALAYPYYAKGVAEAFIENVYKLH